MGRKKSKYQDGLDDAPLEKKAARLFELMGYEVEHNRRKGSTTVTLASTTFDYLHPPTPVYGLQAYLQAYLQAH